ncbi:MAG TPA: hypothetical protein VL442_17155 [Mucilaginibacter sp.]|jgi:hypothetical protein|nr:hypothetical protein [Mucilaginibacter sp.]
MKQTLFMLAFCAAISGCKSKSGADYVSTDTTAKLNYPFTPKYSIKWQPGDEKNALLVLNCLKKYVDGDIKGCAEAFADTSEFIADQFYFKGSKDSLIKMISDMRAASTSVSKEFDSWMTTYYPDKKDTWVTLWYTEKMTDKNGKKDSLYYVDDVLIRDGKIRIYDEKMRRFAPPAKK